MVIFHSYVSLPEGQMLWSQKKSVTWWWFMIIIPLLSHWLIKLHRPKRCSTRNLETVRGTHKINKPSWKCSFFFFAMTKNMVNEAFSDFFWGSSPAWLGCNIWESWLRIALAASMVSLRNRSPHWDLPPTVSGDDIPANMGIEWTCNHEYVVKTEGLYRQQTGEELWIIAIVA